jgi:hypothetical protein
MDDVSGDERRAAEWGLASLALGGVLVLMGPPTLYLQHILNGTGFAGMTRTDFQLAAVGGVMAGLVLVAFAVAGVVFGLWAVGAARRAGVPPARGLVGVMLSGLAVFIWVSAGAAWVGTVWWRF